MKRALTLTIAALLCVLTLTACGSSDGFSDSEKISAKYPRDKDISVTYNYSDGALEPPESYNDFANSAADFSLKLLSSLGSGKKSFAFSPASTVLQLSMLANAASLDVRSDIAKAIGGGTLSPDELNVCCSYFKSRMESVSKAGGADWEKVKLDGAMLVDDSVEVKTSFLSTVGNFYGYDVFRYDLDGENAESKLRDYLDDYTDNSEIKFSKSDELSTVSASEIRDGWLDLYSDSDVTEGVFKGSSGDRKKTFLTSNESALKTDKSVGIVKYTAKNPLKLVLAAPKDPKAFDEYVKGFDCKELSALLNSLDITKTATAVIPEFTIEQSGAAKPLSGAVKSGGAAALFGGKKSLSALSYTSSAALSEMYEVEPEFKLSRSGINAKEESKAEKSGVVKTDETICFDKPFIFLLIDNESNLPVTMGIYR